MAQKDDIKTAVKAFILREFLPGEDPAELTDMAPLITTGVIDSLANLRLVAFLEKQFDIRIDAHEASASHMNTIGDICTLVASKQ